jgi:molybdopterin-biosynthesis enzyme MoeA-like protein
MSGATAGIVITGTEVLTGRIADRNGPWLTEQLRAHGFEVRHITICRDREEDILTQHDRRPRTYRRRYDDRPRGAVLRSGDVS